MLAVPGIANTYLVPQPQQQYRKRIIGLPQKGVLNSCYVDRPVVREGHLYQISSSQRVQSIMAFCALTVVRYTSKLANLLRRTRRTRRIASYCIYHEVESAADQCKGGKLLTNSLFQPVDIALSSNCFFVTCGEEFDISRRELAVSIWSFHPL